LFAILAGKFLPELATDHSFTRCLSMTLELHQSIILEQHSQTMQTAFAAALAGARVIKHYFELGIQARPKDAAESYNLVSDADIDAEQAVVEAIRQVFPSHSILGEEEAKGDLSAAELWIVDPLDGTNNFAHRIPQFSVSIGYYQNGRAECGVVVNPISGDWYWAAAGKGAFHNGRRLQVSSERQLNGSMVGVGFYYDRGAMMEATLTAIHSFFKQQIHGIRRFGSAALDLCYVADGQFGVFFEYQLAPWDFAAGRLIVEEAGGQVSDGRGNVLTLAKTSLLATNGQLHPAALAIVARHHL
jgi:myo-inositol-1(or 4)-monophosphatase